MIHNENDKTIFDLIKKEYYRQTNTINLIASENYVSHDIMLAQGSCLTNKYAEGKPNNRYYGGCKNVDLIESICIDRAKKLFKVEYVNVQPHSGSQANFAVMLSLLKFNDVILGLDLQHGGHLTHGSSVNFSGILYKSYSFKLNKNTGLIDYTDLKNKAYKFKPKVIICGGSSYVRDWDYKFIRTIADSINAIVVADISHISGFVAHNLMNNPIPYCHIITSTTHKTLRGPRGGIIMMHKDFPNPWNLKNKNNKIKMMSEIIDSSVFPGTQGGPLMHVIAGKAIAFLEANSKEYYNYILQVKKNANILSQYLISKNYELISGGTDNHIILVNLCNKNVNGAYIEQKLEKANLIVNKNVIPYDQKSSKITSGIRLGTAAITSRNIKEKDIIEIGEFINQVIQNHNNDNIINKIKQNTSNWIRKFPLNH
ncbi:MAG: serine hydroxymethyltransferase [Bacteroides sp.]|nr:MAG: serine hydroxymethyltransferase [Bacteroides sp.]